ncbi:Lrp/AsnC family transcriptional regulator [archaeon]|nr:MAG: Lrp/AsnC family transcriptional regulator [archaeon]
MNMIDSKDLRILSIIQENCKLSLKELAKRVGLPMTTVHDRIKRLERSGIIKGYRAVLNDKKLGFGVTAFILISFSYELKEGRISQRELVRKIATLPEVQEAHIVTGNWDIIVKVKVEDVDELGRFVVDRLRMIKGVDKTLTCVVLDTVKESGALSLYKIKTQ